MFTDNKSKKTIPKNKKSPTYNKICNKRNKYHFVSKTKKTLNILSQKKHMYELPWNNTLLTKLKKGLKKGKKNNIVYNI